MQLSPAAKLIPLSLKIFKYGVSGLCISRPCPTNLTGTPRLSATGIKNLKVEPLSPQSRVIISFGLYVFLPEIFIVMLFEFTRHLAPSSRIHLTVANISSDIATFSIVQSSPDKAAAITAL